ncbi:MAG: hypothetical protein JXR19_09570 [Bacteroidia bacterium]
MRFLKHFSLLSIALLLVQLTFAQRLLIQYDFLNDDFHYFKVLKNGKKVQIDRAVVTRNHNVKVEVINYNPFVYSAVASYSTKEYTDAPNLNFLSLISPLGLPTGGSAFLSQITGSDPSEAGTRGTHVMADPAARSAYEAVEETYQTLYKAEQMMNNIDFVLSKVHKLKYNPYLPADSIKSFTQSLMNDLFNQPNVETKDFLVLANDINTAVKGNLVAFNSNIESFTQAYNSFASKARDPNFGGKGMDAVVKTWGIQASNFVRNFDSDLLLDKLDALEVVYQSVMNTPYSFNTNDIAKGDELTITIDFYKNPEGAEGLGGSIEDEPKVKSKEIDVTVKGDLKVNSSLGVAFPYYTDNLNFINKDSVITGIDGNNYTPNIAAYLNFYPYNGRNVQVGGTFGVGVPISSDSKNFNFLMGVSTIFGSDNRLVVNFGPTLGQVNKLDNGFEVGDNLGDLTLAVPTRKSYQWGAFVGISFALADLKK